MCTIGDRADGHQLRALIVLLWWSPESIPAVNCSTSMAVISASPNSIPCSARSHAQLESEHGILEIISRAETVRAGIGSGIAYLLGAAIRSSLPRSCRRPVESSLILAAVFVSLIVTSAIGARTGHMNLPRTLARALTVGLGTMAVSCLAGNLIF
jgi:VIT1/CCC1 family predicted Fe2+/Mn2+ transporter